MPINPHPACTEPSPDTIICRYLDLRKFRDLFASEELYLRRVDLFKETDPREAIASDEYIRHVRGLRRFDIHDEMSLNNDQANARQNSEGYFINCWHLFESETMEMWNTYGNCACIFSTVGRLRTAISAFIDPMCFGIVRYSEQNRTGYNMIDFAFTKTYQFQSDKELRILLQCYDPMHRTNRNISPEGFFHREPLDELYPVNPWVPDCKRRRIDLKSIVTEIRLDPWLTKETAEEIQRWIKNKNFTCPLRPSDLTSRFAPTPEEFEKYS
jgi:hypothetical protein